ncbi:MAG: hypothetical protein GXY55_00015 [Phycisphaerae bacterium]|nr:hypothetical protein [Phycisphaerae bacterium]
MSELNKQIEARLRTRFAQLRAEAGTKLPDNFFQPVFDHLDELVDVVASLQDYSTEPYMDKVRQVICTQCLASPDGRCVRRDAHACGLDVYFPIIVGVIEQALRADPGLPA